MIDYFDFVELAKKYSLHIYNTVCYLSNNKLFNDKLMEYSHMDDFVIFYPKITLYGSNIEVRNDTYYEIHTTKELENALKEFLRNCKEFKIQYKKESIEEDFK